METELLGFGLYFATKSSINHCLHYIKSLDSFITKKKSSIKDLRYLKSLMLNSILYLFINLTIFDVIIKSNLDILTTKADRGNNAELIPSCTTVQRIKNCGPALTPLSLNPFVKTYDALLLNTLTLFYHFRTVFCLFIIFLKFINVPFFRLANPVPGLG